MPICKPIDLPSALKPAARLVGLDVGAATVGIAVSDPSLTIATARTTIRRGRRFRETGEAIAAFIDQTNIGGIIVGLPLSLSGGMSPRAQAAKAFANNVLAVRDIPIAFWDERMSTNAVQRPMLEADMSRAKRGAAIDAAAAAFILQGYLDFLKDGGHVTNFTLN
ncbi:MAG: Holliday junction resolvase RuvX [Alphaproteobacteria bacterium]